MRLVLTYGMQQVEDCYNGDEDASWDPRSVETGSHAKLQHWTNITSCTSKGYASDEVAMDKEEMRTSSTGLVIKLSVISHGKPRMIRHDTSSVTFHHT